MEVFRFIVGCNNGRGLSNDSTVWLLNLLREECLNLVLLQHWHTLHAVLQYGMSRLMAKREYETHTFVLPNWPTPFEAVRELLRNPANAEGFVLFPREEDSGAGRMYSTPETATYWEEAHRAAVATFGEGTVVIPLILSSDATMLSGNERTKVWAVYISIANIPLHRRWQECGKLLLAMLPFPPSQMSPAEKTALFQAAMKIVLADLIVASHTDAPRAQAAEQHRDGPCKVCCNQSQSEIRNRKLLNPLAPHSSRTLSMPAPSHDHTGHRHGHPQVTRAAMTLTSVPHGGEPADSVFQQLNEALGGILATYDGAMRAACLRPFPAKAHTALALPAGETDLGTLRPQYVRAAASLHGHTAFSCVEYETAAGQLAHGRLLMLLEAEQDVPEMVQEVEVAVIHRLVDRGLDEHTGCCTLSAP
ncbi:unnamed protein product [Closterium sp. NIES-54]